MLKISGPDNSKTLKVDCVKTNCVVKLSHITEDAIVNGVARWNQTQKDWARSWFYYLLAVDLGQDSVPILNSRFLPVKTIMMIIIR